MKKKRGDTGEPDLEHLLAMLDGIDDVMYVADPERFELLYVNRAARDIWGEDILGKKCHLMLQGRDAPCPFCTNDKIFGEFLGQTYVWEFQNEVTKGWFRCSDKAIPWVDGRFVRFELASDITDEKRSAEALHESEARFARIADALPDMIYSMSLPDGKYEYVSPASSQIFGYEPEEFMSDPLLIQRIVHPDWHDYFAREWEKLLADQAPPTYEYQITHKDGSARWMNQRNVVLREAPGKPTAIWGIVTDITESKVVHQAMQERVKELTCMQTISALINRDEDVTMERMAAEAAEALSLAFQHQQDAVVHVELDGAEFATGNVETCKALLQANIETDGSATGCDIQVGYTSEHAERDEGPFLNEERHLIDAVAGMLATFVARRRAQEGLKRSQMELEQRVLKRTQELQEKNEYLNLLSAELTVIMDSVPGLVFYKDTENRYLRVNQYVADAHHMAKEDLEGKDCFDIYPQDQAQAYFDDDKIVIKSGQAKLNIEELWHTEEGTRWVSTSKIPYVDEHGTIQGVIGVAMDITERKMAEQALQRQMKLAGAISRILREAITCDTEERLAQTTLDIAEEITGSKFGFVGELNDAGRFDTIGISNPGWDACAIEGSTATRLIKNMELRGIWSAVIKTGHAKIVNDPANHPDKVGVPDGHPALTRFLGAPFIKGGSAVGMIALANKEEDYEVDDKTAVEAIAASFFEALQRKRLEVQVRRESMLKTAQAELAEKMAGNLSLDALCANVIVYLCSYLKAPTGLIFVANADGTLELQGSYAHKRRKDRSYEFKPGEGLVGQAAAEKRPILLEDLPESYFTIESGLGAAQPRSVYVTPLMHNGRVNAVLEFGLLNQLDAFHEAFLKAVSDFIATAVNSAQARRLQARLLEESQQLSEELQAQQEELRVTNEELEEQTHRLQDSEARLKAQQEELQVTNEELEEKHELLQRQNKDVEQAKLEIAEKAEALARASKYKSEFLANMSHELRTPLNSLLLLAHSLAENKNGNLTDDQVESAQVIHQGGNELLSLINEILDLSKIEAGRMDLAFGPIRVSDLADAMRRSFHGMAEAKGLAFDVVIKKGAPTAIDSDRKRVEQVLKNLVSNAIKFTEQGHVTVTFAGVESPDGNSAGSSDAETDLKIMVADSGVGISQTDQKVIFEAFQQAEGGTDRRFGGTGLGLSIVREFTRLLGGEVDLASEPGKGSTFTLRLPAGQGTLNAVDTPRQRDRHPPPVTAAPKPVPQIPTIPDDRDQITAQDRCVLIIEDDARFAKILAKQCRDQGFKILAAATGEEGVDLARRFSPRGVLLDLKLPGIDGWRVLEILKENPKTRHIPVHIASVDDPSAQALQKGAVGFVQKPATADQIRAALHKIDDTAGRQTKRVLVVEDDDAARRGIVELIADDQVIADGVPGGKQALEALQAAQYDCMVLDLGLQDMTGDQLLKQIQGDARIVSPPVVVYTAQDLSWEEDLNLRSFADSVVIKGVRSDERLLDEVSLFLHRVVADMPEKKRQVIANLHDADALLRDKTILIVDDDMRALFALSRILSNRGMHIVKAENGEKALAALEREDHVDIVLMDIMMPVLDGYETMRRIRSQPEFKDLPIIALTAKAMRGDKERCIEAGANDYLPKPVDQERLISMLRVWLYR